MSNSFASPVTSRLDSIVFQNLFNILTAVIMNPAYLARPQFPGYPEPLVQGRDLIIYHLMVAYCILFPKNLHP